MNIYTLAFVLLLVLKLTAIVNISWWLVFAPLLVWMVVFSIIVLLAGLLSLKSKK